ncbi:NUDIX-family hydrolase [Escherichia coli]|uniref:NUDIX-family hydrolase n=1 Tax=Escherichia coli TaxID=562 RepID=A0A376LMX1_ECOLX|nr:NUDIX-family hydrolase [Escherichia coli]
MVGIIPPDLPYRASEDEVSAVFEMPLAQALHLGRYHPLDIYPPWRFTSGMAVLVRTVFCMGNDRRHNS